jgi:hypothetical protein
MRVASFRVITNVQALEHVPLAYRIIKMHEWMTNVQALEHVPLAYRIIKMHEWTEDSSLVELEGMGVLQMREWERDMLEHRKNHLSGGGAIRQNTENVESAIAGEAKEGRF